MSADPLNVCGEGKRNGVRPDLLDLWDREED